MKRSLSIFLSALPFLIVLGLLYAAFFIKPSVDGNAVPPPAMARNDIIYGVSTPDAGITLWAAGSYGKIWVSRDKGMNWALQPTPVTEPLQDIATWAERAREWRRFGDWLEAVAANGVSPNIGSFLGGGTLRQYACGMRMGRATSDELATMRRVMDEAMDDGAHLFRRT